MAFNGANPLTIDGQVIGELPEPFQDKASARATFKTIVTRVANQNVVTVTANDILKA